MRAHLVSIAALLWACSGTGATDAGAADAGEAGSCPDEHGAYSVAATGAGCGDLATSAPQCIQQVGCGLSFISSPSATQRALNGSTTIGADGSFANAAITEGTSSRSGCTGSWDSTSQTLTVDCGGTGTSQSCDVTLTRTGATCN